MSNRREKKSDATEDVKVEKEEVSGSFNQGLPDDASPDIEPDPVVELKEPTRPVTGEIFVPSELNDPLVPSAIPSIVEDDLDSEKQISLRPENMTVYKIIKGDTLWGIARKNNVTLNVVLKSNPNLTKNSKLRIGQEIMIPIGNASEIIPSSNAVINVPTGSSSYTVMGGDSLSKIARLNGVSLVSLMNANGLSQTSIIRPGQILIIPNGSTSPSVVSSPPQIIPAGANIHLVKKRKNLTKIASLYGTTVKNIMDLNNLSDASMIKLGQSLVVSTEMIDSSPVAPEVPVDPVDQEARLQDFFKGDEEEKPIIDVPDQPDLSIDLTWRAWEEKSGGRSFR